MTSSHKYANDHWENAVKNYKIRNVVKALPLRKSIFFHKNRF